MAESIRSLTTPTICVPFLPSFRLEHTRVTGYYDNDNIIINEVFEAGGNMASRTLTVLNGLGQTKQVDTWIGGTWNSVQTKYNNLGQVGNRASRMQPVKPSGGQRLSMMRLVALNKSLSRTGAFPRQFTTNKIALLRLHLCQGIR